MEVDGRVEVGGRDQWVEFGDAHAYVYSAVMYAYA